MRTYSKSLAIANRILGSESSKIYYTISSQGAVHQDLVFGVITVIPEQSLQLHSIELGLQEASSTDVTCRLVIINSDNLESISDETDDVGAPIDITIPAGSRRVLQEISPKTLVNTYKYGLKVQPTVVPDSTENSYGEGLTASYVLSYV